MNADDQARVFIEAGRKRVFASVLEWPGWARSGRSEELAMEALAEYLPRYERVARRAGMALPPGNALVVTGRLDGLAKLADFGR